MPSNLISLMDNVIDFASERTSLGAVEIQFYSRKIEMLLEHFEEFHPNISTRIPNIGCIKEEVGQILSSPVLSHTILLEHLYKQLIMELQLFDQWVASSPLASAKTKAVGKIFPSTFQAFLDKFHNESMEYQKLVEIEAAGTAIVLGEIKAGVRAISAKSREAILTVICELLDIPLPQDEDFDPDATDMVTGLLGLTKEELVEIVYPDIEMAAEMILETRYKLGRRPNGSPERRAARFNLARPHLMVNSPEDYDPYIQGLYFHGVGSNEVSAA